MFWTILLLVFISLTLAVYASLTSGSQAWGNYAERFSTETEGNLRGLFLFADGRRLLAVYMFLLVGLPVALLAIGLSPLIVGGVAIALFSAPRVLLSRLADQRRKKINAALPDGLAQIAGAMRAGSTFTVALQSMVEEQKGPLGQEFSLVLREQRLGARLEEALDNLGERVQTEEMDLVISAALIAQEVGGNLAEILGSLSDNIRRKLEMEGKVRALTAQGLLQGRVVTLLPFLILGALLFIEPDAIRPIWTSILGWVFLAVMISLQVMGSVVIKKIVTIEI
jgi:tight adherence protein B